MTTDQLAPQGVDAGKRIECEHEIGVISQLVARLQSTAIMNPQLKPRCEKLIEGLNAESLRLSRIAYGLANPKRRRGKAKGQ